MKVRYYIFFGLLLLAIGFGLGRWAMPTPEPKVEYITLDPVKGEDKPELISEVLEPEIKYIRVYIPSEDTAQPASPEGPKTPILDTLASLRATVLDWNLKRQFAGVFFDTPELGRMEYTAEVQYNTLIKTAYNYTPVQKQTTIVKPEKMFTPFVRASYNSFNQVSLGGGAFIKNIGVDLYYIRDVKQEKSGFGAGVSLKF